MPRDPSPRGRGFSCAREGWKRAGSTHGFFSPSNPRAFAAFVVVAFVVDPCLPSTRAQQRRTRPPFAARVISDVDRVVGDTSTSHEWPIGPTFASRAVARFCGSAVILHCLHISSCLVRSTDFCFFASSSQVATLSAAGSPVARTARSKSCASTNPVAPSRRRTCSSMTPSWAPSSLTSR